MKKWIEFYESRSIHIQRSIVISLWAAFTGVCKLIAMVFPAFTIVSNAIFWNYLVVVFLMSIYYIGLLQSTAAQEKVDRSL